MEIMGSPEWAAAPKFATGAGRLEHQDELDERIEDVEYKIDEVGRGQVARELLLLRQRVGELESVISDSDDRKGQDAIHLLVDRLGELESRIDTLPWPTIDVSDDVSY